MTALLTDFVADGTHVTRWGRSSVVAVHGGTPGGGAEAFAAQRPLSQRWQLVLPDRPGHGGTPEQGREDFERDAHLLAPLLSAAGSHLVGHSYGGIVAIYLAALRPALIRSLTLIEPPAYWLAPDDDATVAMSHANRELCEHPPTDLREALDRFFELVGIAPLPPGLDRTKPLPPPLQHAARIVLALRGPWEGSVAMAELADPGYPIQVLTSGRTAGFEGIARAFVTGAAGQHHVVPDTAHAVQDDGEQVNPLLDAFWAQADGEDPAAN